MNEEDQGAVPKGRTNRCNGLGFSHGYHDTRKKEIVATRSPERAERGRRESESDVITNQSINHQSLFV